MPRKKGRRHRDESSSSDSSSSSSSSSSGSEESSEKSPRHRDAASLSPEELSAHSSDYSDEEEDSEALFLSSESSELDEAEFDPLEARLRLDAQAWDGPLRRRDEISAISPLQEHLEAVARRADLIERGEIDVTQRARPERAAGRLGAAQRTGQRKVPPPDPNEPPLPTDNDEKNGGVLECLCAMRAVATINIPCGHPVFCVTCSQRYHEDILARSSKAVCPHCRVPMSEIVRAYLPKPQVAPPGSAPSAPSKFSESGKGSDSRKKRKHRG